MYRHGLRCQKVSSIRRASTHFFMLSQKLLDGETTCRFVIRRRHSHTLWFLADVVGLFSINVVSFLRNVVLRDALFSANLVPKRGCYRFEPIMFSVRYTYNSTISTV